ncbi:MAG: hypothetical protein J6P73_05800 [Bacteroidales bacterium]|nr:hypothetical protein [Bacteroidales bacterium]
MKKLLSISLLFGLLALFVPVTSVAQDDIAEFVMDEMNSYYKDLIKLDQQIVTAEDAEQYENRYKNQIKLVESCYSDYTEIFRYDKKLYAVYENYTDLYQQLGKRIDGLKTEKAKQERIDKLTVKLNRYLEQLTELEAAGNRSVSNKRLDSLNIVKKQAEECYVEEATLDYGANRDFIDEDEELSRQWRKIKDTYSRISTMEIVKSPFDMTFILEIVGVIAALVLIVNIISTKVKAARALKPKIPKSEKKKKNEEIPSI